MVINNNVDLTNNYASLESFRSNKPVSQPKVETIPVTEKSDEVKISQESQQPEAADKSKEKKSFIRRFKDGMASIKKFFIGVGEYTKGTVKGIFYGGIGAGAVLGADAIMGASKIIKNAKAGEVAGKAVKVLSTKGKVAAGVVGLAVLGYQLFKASLNASEKNANVDHRWGSGHNQG